MSVPISNVTRRVVFAPSGTGPYAFTFEILAETDIEVYKGDTKLTLTTDYTVTINPNGTGSVTLVATAGTDNITIIGAKAIQRTTDFVTGGDFFANTINTELDSLTIFAQQNAEAVTRALQAPETDPTTINMTLPRKADRAGKYLAFDDVTGDPVPGETPAELAATLAIADAISAVALIDDEVVVVANNITAVISVDSIASETNLVGDNISAVIAVALDLSGTNTIGTVAADFNGSANISIVGDDISSVVTVASNISGVLDVAADLNGSGNISIVATDLDGSANISIVGNNISGVLAVGNNISGVLDVAADLNGSGNISIVATDLDGSGNINIVGNNILDVVSVGDNISGVISVAADLDGSGNISIVANDLAGANTIGSAAAVAADIATVAAIADAISAVATIDQADLSAVAVVSDEVAVVAAVASSVSAVATIASDVTTVATNVADVTNFSDVYLGPASSDPATRNDSSALQAGDLYFNTNDNAMKVYTGAVWAAAYVSGTGFLATTGGTMTGDILMGGQADLRFGDSDSSNYVAFQAPATVASNVVFTLPATDGSTGQAMVTDGSGGLSFGSAGISTGKAIAMAIVFG
jgi:hypothetical protein